MAGSENLPRPQSACLHSVLLPCSLKGPQNNQGSEKAAAVLEMLLERPRRDLGGRGWSQKSMALAIKRGASLTTPA